MRLQMKVIYVGVVALPLGGCGKGIDVSSASELPQAPVTRTIIETAVGTYVGYGASLKIWMLDTPSLELDVGGNQLDEKGVPIARKKWYTTIAPSVTDVLGGDFVVPIRYDGLQESTAQVSTVVLAPDNSFEGSPATSGTLTVKLSKGTLSGQAVAVPELLSATFRGDLFVQCAVSFADLPAVEATAGTTVGTGGSAQPYVGDADFVTPKCQPFAKWRP